MRRSTSMLVVTIRESEERGMCSAALTELLRVVRDQIGERGVVIIVTNRESTVWRKTSVKTLLTEKQLKNTEEMRVVTNDRPTAEQIKSDSTLSAQGNLLRSKVKNVVMGGQKLENLEKVGREQKLNNIVMDGVKSGKGEKVKSVVMNGVKTGKVGKLENCKTDEEMWSQSEERLCKSIIEGLARRNRERHKMLADVAEEQEQDVICFDDITSKELLWHAVRKARELELKYLRDLGVYEKVDEKEAVAKYGITQVDTKWVDTDKAFEGEPMQIRSRMCAKELKSDDQPDLYAVPPPLEALKATTSIAAFHKETFSIMNIDVSRAYFRAKAQRPVLIRLPVGDRMGTDAGKVRLLKKSMYGTRDAASNWERDWQEHVRNWGFQSSKNRVPPQRGLSVGFDTR